MPVTMESAVSLADLRAITPVLLCFIAGGAVLLADLFRRTGSLAAGGAGGAAAGGRAAALPPPGAREAGNAITILAAAGAGLAGVAVIAALDLPTRFVFGGALRVDLFSNALSAVIVLAALFTAVSAPGYLRRRGLEEAEFQALCLFGAGAMVLLTQANDLITLFLSLETFSMAAYVLAGFSRDEKRSVEGGLKYLVLGGFSSGFLLLGLALAFGATGEVRFDLMKTEVAAGRADGPLLLAGGGLVLVGFGFKLGAFPFQAWIPDAYEGAPTPATGFMAVAVKTAGFAALTRLILSVAGQATGDLQRPLTIALAALAIATCVFGNLVAVVQSSAKRMLAYSSIAHTGYLLIGLACAVGPGGPGQAGPNAASAVVFYLLPYALMTYGAFAVLAHAARGQAESESFESFRGLAQRRPGLAFSMLVFMVSLAGIPPTAGFWAKLYLFREAVAAGRWDLALVGILTSIVAVYYYLRLVVVMFMQPARATGAAGAPGTSPAAAPLLEPEEARGAGGLVIALCAAGILVIGLLPEGLLDEARRSVMDPLLGLLGGGG